MKTLQRFVQQGGGKKLISLSLAAVLAGTSVSAFASGFQLFEENGSGAANYSAGGAAEAADASTNFFNPAGLTRIKHWQVVGAATGIWAHSEFTGTVTNQLLAGGVPAPIPPLATGSGSSSAGAFNVVPATFFAARINQRAVFGIGITAPFGLETDYSPTAFTRYAATKSKVATININPNLGIELTKNVSIGGGIDIQQFTATLNSVANLGPNTDSNSTNYAHDWGFGWNAGILFTSNDDNTRAGLSFRSEIKHNAEGGSILDGPLVVVLSGQRAPIFSPNANTTIKLPSTTIASVWHRLNPKWAFMGTVAYTNWSVFRQVVLNNVAGSVSPVTGQPVPVVIPQNFRDSWRVAAGADYTLNDKVTLRGGLGFDQSPLNNTDRNLRLPGNDRIAVAAGVSYQATKKARIDAGYTHLFIKKSSINVSQPQSSTIVTTVGTNKASADLIGVQITYDIDNVA